MRGAPILSAICPLSLPLLVHAEASIRDLTARIGRAKPQTRDGHSRGHPRSVILSLLLLLQVIPSLASAQVVRELDLVARHVIWDPVTRRLYASVMRPEAHGNSVAVIEPVSGTIERYVVVGNTPDRLAVSEDGAHLYVGVNGDHSVRRIDLAEFAVSPLAIDLGVDSYGGPNEAVSIAVLPGSPHSVAVGYGSSWSSTKAVAVFDDGVCRSKSATAYSPSELVFGEDAAHLYGGSDASGPFAWFAVDASGVTLIRNSEEQWGAPLRWDQGRLTSASGYVLDGATERVIGRYWDMSRAVAFDPDGKHVYFANWWGNIDQWDPNTFVRTWTAVLPTNATSSDANDLTALIAWDNGRLARQSLHSLQLIDVGAMVPLTISKSGHGDGVVSASPPISACRSLACTTPFPAGKTVTLFVEPGPNSRFLRWEGDPDCSDGVVTMTEATSCRAVFGQLTTGLGLEVPLDAHNLAYSSTTGKLYVTIPGGDSLRGNTVTEVDADTGDLGRAVWVGSDLGLLSMAKDGKTLWVGVNRGRALRKVDVESMTAGLQFSPTSAAGYDMAVLPNDPDSVVIAQKDGVHLYRNGVHAASWAPTAYAIYTLGLSTNGARAYGNDLHSRSLQRFDVTASGLVVGDITAPLSDDLVTVADGRLFLKDGSVVDPESLVTLGRISIGTPIWWPVIMPDLSNGTVSVAAVVSEDQLAPANGDIPTDTRLTRFDTASYALRDSRLVPGTTGWHGDASVSGDSNWTPDYSPSWNVPIVGLATGRDRLAYLGSALGMTYSERLLLVHFGEAVVDSVAVECDYGPIDIAVGGLDVDGEGSGTTPLLRRFARGSRVTIGAPATLNDKVFRAWSYDGIKTTANPITVSVSGSFPLKALYGYAPPSVMSVSPSSGIVTGGGTITVTGEGFRGPITLEIGGAYAVPSTLFGSTTIVATLPPHAAGVVSVKVTNGDGQSATLPSAFTYVPAVTLDTLTSTPPYPGAATTSVIWHATAHGGIGPLQFQFWLTGPAGATTLLRDWDASSEMTWTPDRAGTYAVEVRVRSNGSSATYEARLSSGLFSTVGEPQAGDPGDIPVPGDYDGDHISDVAVFRPSTGYWYIMRSSFPTSRTGKISIRWGLPTDVPVAGDYDGDGKADIGVWRPSTGHWYVLLSSRNYSMNSYLDVQWGYPTDRPMPGDYDGDGRTDIGVWRASTGHWYVLLSSESYWPGSYLDVLWGYATDQPLLGDFDGDGRADIGVWRSSTGYWYVLWSSQQYRASTYLAAQWGFSTDVPQVGDFDGDGKADIAVWRPSTGYWYARLSGQGYATSSYLAQQWGLSTDLPVPADYDGDGKTDLSVHRRSDATSYVLDSSHAFRYDFYRWIACGSWLTGV